MDLLTHAFHLLEDTRNYCSCSLGENVRTLLSLDHFLGHRYAFYAGEVVCFCFHAQRRLFHHLVAALHCYFGLVVGTGRGGPLAFRDSWAKLLLDVPRVALVLFGLHLLLRLVRFAIQCCCGPPTDGYGMGARLHALRVAEMYENRNETKQAVESMIRASRALEFDRLWEHLLISPRYIWNGVPFGKLRNNFLGRAYLLTLWVVYICPMALRVSLLVARLGIDIFEIDAVANACEPDTFGRAAFAGGLASAVVFVMLAVVPSRVLARTQEERYH
jgi:hypothetical protein